MFGYGRWTFFFFFFHIHPLIGPEPHFIYIHFSLEDIQQGNQPQKKLHN